MPERSINEIIESAELDLPATLYAFNIEHRQLRKALRKARGVLEDVHRGDWRLIDVQLLLKKWDKHD